MLIKTGRDGEEYLVDSDGCLIEGWKFRGQHWAVADLFSTFGDDVYTYPQGYSESVYYLTNENRAFYGLGSNVEVIVIFENGDGVINADFHTAQAFSLLEEALLAEEEQDYE